MYVTTAKHCAWRAFYIYRGKRPSPGQYGGAQIFHLGIDPTWMTSRARLFGGIALSPHRPMWRWSVMLPRSRHWWKLDGRLPRNAKG
jgi:hypothetical protein